MPVIVNSQSQLGMTTQYRLSIQADLNGFSFCVIDNSQKSIQYLYGSDFPMNPADMEGFAKQSSKLFKKESLLKAHYKESNLIVGTHKFVAIPTSIHNPLEDLQNLKRVHSTNELDEVHSIEIAQEEMTIIYSVDSTLLQVIKRFQPNIKIYPSIYIYLTQLPTFPEYNKLFIRYIEGVVIIVAVEGKKIVMCNSYPAHHFNSALYFLLSIMKEVQFNPEQTTVYISGNMKELDIFDITKYFSKVKYFRNSEIPLYNSKWELKYAELLF